MATSTPMTEQSLTQLIAKADAELVTLQTEAESAEKQKAAAQSELDAISSRQATRALSLHQAEESVTKLRSALETAQARSRLSENTLASDPEPVSIQDLEKRLRRSESDLSKFRAKLGKEEDADHQHTNALLRALDAAQTSLDANLKTQQAINSAREQAFGELGQLLQKAIVQRLQHLKEQVEVWRQALAKAEQELDGFSTEASQTLLDWPDLLREIKPQLSYRDRSTDILEAQLQVINLLLSEGLGANIESSEVFRRADLPWADMPGLLSFDPANFYPAFNGSNSPTVLLERKEAIEKVLASYREEKKGIASVERFQPAKRHRW